MAFTHRLPRYDLRLSHVDIDPPVRVDVEPTLVGEGDEAVDDDAERRVNQFKVDDCMGKIRGILFSFC